MLHNISFKPRTVWICVFFLVLIQSCAYSQGNTKTVFITRTGEKYHRGSCHYLKYSSYEIAINEAKERGYTPCSVCKPGNGTTQTQTTSSPNTSNQQLMPTPQQNQATDSQQCTAITKAGTRCKRTTTYSNSKCWQHQ